MAFVSVMVFSRHRRKPLWGSFLTSVMIMVHEDASRRENPITA